MAAAEPPEFIPEAQIRPRWEADSGKDGAQGGEVSYVSMRSRLGATLRSDDVSVRLVFSDVRVWGSELDTRRDFSSEGLDVRIAQLTYAPGATSIEVGRMERGLHDERLLAIANWRQPGRSFDGARVAWQGGSWSFDGRAFVLREGDVLDLATTDQAVQDTPDRTLFVLSGGLDDTPARVLPTLLVDYDGAEGRLRGTGGVFSRVDAGDFRLRSEAYLQLAQQEGQSTRGGMAGVEAAWAPPVDTKPALGVGYEWLSGDRGDNEAVAPFNTLFGANHRYYGHIDIAVFQVGGFGDGQGLQDLRGLARVSPTPAVDLLLDAHVFLAAIEGTFLAFEPDLEARVHIAEPLTWSSGVNLWLADTPDWMLWSALDARF